MLVPLGLEIQLGPGWWSSPPVVAVFTVLVAVLMISRVPTASLKSVKVSPRWWPRDWSSWRSGSRRC